MSNVPSQFEIIGNDRTTWTYLPPSVLENPKPIYDVIYLLDYGPTFGDLLTPSLNDIFTGRLTEDAIVIGFGDYVPTSDGKSDRRDLLTTVRTPVFQGISQ